MLNRTARLLRFMVEPARQIHITALWRHFTHSNRNSLRLYSGNNIILFLRTVPANRFSSDLNSQFRALGRHFKDKLLVKTRIQNMLPLCTAHMGMEGISALRFHAHRAGNDVFNRHRQLRMIRFATTRTIWRTHDEPLCHQIETPACVKLSFIARLSFSMISVI